MASYNLGTTQRDIIRGHEIYDEERRAATAEDVQVELRNNPDFNKNKVEETEKKRYWLAKCFLLVIGLLILLAGMIVLIYFFKKHEFESGPRGIIYTTVKPSKECEDVVVALGKDVEIICKMNYNDDIPGDVDAIYANKVWATPKNFTCNSVNKTVSCKAKQKARCSSYGEVIIRFYDSVFDDKKVESTRTVKLFDTGTSVTATIEQMESDPTQFRLNCSYTSCSSYGVGFYGRNNISIADSVSCTTTFSDSEGYRATCSATVSSKVIYKYGDGSVLNCHLKHGDKVQESKELVLPDCRDIPIRKKECHANKTNLFDCANTQEAMNSCNKYCMLAKECFSAREYEIPTNTSSYICPECALKWCRETDTLRIDNNGTISFDQLCRDV